MDGTLAGQPAATDYVSVVHARQLSARGKLRTGERPGIVSGHDAWPYYRITRFVDDPSQGGRDTSKQRVQTTAARGRQTTMKRFSCFLSVPVFALVSSCMPSSSSPANEPAPAALKPVA